MKHTGLAIGIVALVFVGFLPFLAVPTAAIDVPKFLVTDDAACSLGEENDVLFSGDCWALTSGGISAGIAPDSDDSMVFDVNSGAAAVISSDAATPFLSTGTMTFVSGYTGQFNVALASVSIGTFLHNSDTVFTIEDGGGVLEVFGVFTLNAGTFIIEATDSPPGALELEGNIVLNVGLNDGEAGCIIALQIAVAATVSGTTARFDPCTLRIVDDGTITFLSDFATQTVRVFVGGGTFAITPGVVWSIQTTGAVIGNSAEPNLLRIRSVTPGIPWLLYSGNIFEKTTFYVSVSDSDASGAFGLPINACGIGNVDSGGNTGWDFCAPPPPPSALCFDDLAGGLPVTAILIVLIGLSVLLIVVGAFLTRKSDSGDTSSMVALVIGVIVFAIFAAALIGFLPAC